MSFIPNGVKNLKRHSIANITETLRGHTGSLIPGHRGSLVPHFRSKSPHRTAFPTRNAHFESITSAVVQLFQKKRLQEGELTTLQDNVRHLIKTEAGPLIYDYYKDKLMKKGMVILRESIKNESGKRLLTKLAEQWDYFYKEILPVLQVLLFPVITKDLSIRQVTLLEFRNIVLLKVPFSDALDSSKDTNGNLDIPPSIEQMLLVLQGVKESPCTDNYVRLEKLVARVISPYLGMLGLYNGSSEPDVKSSVKPPPRVFVIEETYDDEEPEDHHDDLIGDLRQRRSKLSSINLPHRPSLSGRFGNGLLTNHFLTPVKEQEAIRRHSIDHT